MLDSLACKCGGSGMLCKTQLHKSCSCTYPCWLWSCASCFPLACLPPIYLAAMGSL